MRTAGVVAATLLALLGGPACEIAEIDGNARDAEVLSADVTPDAGCLPASD